MEQHSLKNVNNCLNTSIYFYLETSGACVIKLFTAVIDYCGIDYRGIFLFNVI